MEHESCRTVCISCLLRNLKEKRSFTLVPRLFLDLNTLPVCGTKSEHPVELQKLRCANPANQTVAFYCSVNLWSRTGSYTKQEPQVFRGMSCCCKHDCRLNVTNIKKKFPFLILMLIRMFRICLHSEWIPQNSFAVSRLVVDQSAMFSTVNSTQMFPGRKVLSGTLLGPRNWTCMEAPAGTKSLWWAKRCEMSLTATFNAEYTGKNLGSKLYRKAERSWLMQQQRGLNQTDLIEATFLWVRLHFQSYSCIQYTLDTTHPLTQKHLRVKVTARFSVDDLDWIKPESENVTDLISSQTRIKDRTEVLLRMCSRTFFFYSWVCGCDSLCLHRLHQQSGFGHRARTVHENARSRLQRLCQDYSSQEHEITLWQIQLAWQDTMSLIRSHSVPNQIAYKCPKLNQAAPWNVASWLCWSLTQTGQHLAPWTDFVFS